MPYFADWPKSLREGVFLFGALLLAYVLLSLFSFSTADPTPLSTVGDGEETKNLGGVVGSTISFVLFSLLGRSAYLLCAVFVLFWRGLWLRRAAPDFDAVGLWLTMFGVVLCIVSSAAIEYLRFHYSDGLPFGAGGWVGKFIGESMRALFGMTGASLLLFAIWLFSWSLVLGLSWFAFFEKIGEHAERGAAAVLRFCQAVLRRRRARRQKILLAAVAAAAKKEPTLTATAQQEPILTKTPLLAITKPPRRRPVDAAKKPAAASTSSTLSASTTAENTDAAPTLQLLDAAANDGEQPEELLDSTATLIEKSLASFNVSVKVVKYHPGPIVTRYDLQPATGVKGAQVVGLARDLARALAASAIRVLESIPGTNTIGLEIPNRQRASVNLLEILSSVAYRDSTAALPLALGKTAVGDAAVVDLSAMPHLLVAGSTGSGKSVFINAILLSLLFCRTPQQLRFLLIDPKMLELATYADIPHLLAPVVTDMDHAPAALHWAIGEMERRYRLMADAGVRHIVSYNAAVEKEEVQLPYIVVVIDELADLMMVAGKKVELSISRLAQKARAAGINMVLATQRPSVDVITGLIKANIPCRLSFQVASKVDSRTVLDQMGAETLLGKGDMLYLPSGGGVPQRLHGAFVSDDEVRRVVEHIRRNNRDVEYLMDFSVAPAPASAGGASASGGGEEDPLYDEAVNFIVQNQRVSISMVQRRLRIGYNRAARIVENMEQAGLVSPMNELGARKVLTPKRD